MNTNTNTTAKKAAKKAAKKVAKKASNRKLDKLERENAAKNHFLDLKDYFSTVRVINLNKFPDTLDMKRF